MRSLSMPVKREEKMALTLYFLRHGQTALSREDIFCGSGLDPELTPEGMEMAQAFVKAYREAEWRAVYSSSLRRGITTAQPFCDALGIELQVRAELNEIGYGRWEGLTKERSVNSIMMNTLVGWLIRPGMRQPEENWPLQLPGVAYK